MRPAIVSGIAIGDAPVSYWPIFSPVPSNSPISLCKSNSTQFPCRFDCGELLSLFEICFLSQTKQIESWMNEKLQTASEASYRETSNLLQKQQKHQTFEAELTANKGQLDNVLSTGQALVNSTPRSRETVEAKLKDLNELWKFLGDMSSNKGQRLKEAIQRQTFEKNVGDLESWITENENSLASKVSVHQRSLLENLKKN